MKLEYQLKDIGYKNKAKCIGDLIGYYATTKYKTLEGLEKIKNNKTICSMLINTLRKHNGMTGMTIDTLLNNLEVANKIQLFTFTSDTIDYINYVEQSKDLTLIVEMNDLYFTTKATLAANMPGFRISKRPLEKTIEKEKEKWVQWFEKELKNYYRYPFQKKILEI